MNAIAIALRVLPLIVALVEVLLGAKKGEVKKSAVTKFIGGLLGVFAWFNGARDWDTPEFRELLSRLIDEIVAAANDSGIFKKSPEPAGP